MKEHTRDHAGGRDFEYPAATAYRCRACQFSLVHPQFANQRFRGDHVGGPVGEIPVQFVARNGVIGFDVACRERGLYARTAGGLQRRCVSSLQRGDSRRRPRHGLHGPQAGSTLAGLPGVFQTVRARTRGQGGSASQHQAGGCAKARQRETVSAKTTCPPWADLTVFIPARQNIASSPICSCCVATARAAMMCSR